MKTNITNNHRLKRKDLVEPDLSYRIVGILFRVFNELGPGLKEKYYQKALAVGLKEEAINFQEQSGIDLNFANEKIGKYFTDFVIDGKIVLELKTGNQINRRHAKQLMEYLKVTNLKLGILAYFGRDGVFFKRILNVNNS